MFENYTELMSTIANFLNGTVEIKDNQIIITLKEDDDNKEKIDKLENDTFIAICKDLGTEKVKEYSDNENYEAFVEYAKDN